MPYCIKLHGRSQRNRKPRTVIKAAHRSPNTAAFVERFIQTLQQECLDCFVAFSQ